MKLSVVSLSICLSVRPSVRPIIRPLHTAVVGLLLWARRALDIVQLLLGWCTAANASSVILLADVGSRRQFCYSSVHRPVCSF